ncbi:hypothetical protein PMAYCL1PPCAC_27519, partial [Pristionchus mayeri]
AQFQRQVRCDFTNGRAELVYEGNEMSGKYTGELICRPLSEERLLRNPCPYTCSETAQCSANSLECACLKGFRDLSSQHHKANGSICSKYVNSPTNGTDYVILLDVSGSIKPDSANKMIDFLSDF